MHKSNEDVPLPCSFAGGLDHETKAKPWTMMIHDGLMEKTLKMVCSPLGRTWMFRWKLGAVGYKPQSISYS